MAQAQVDIVLSNGQKAGETLKELGKTANKLNKEIKDLKPGTQDFVKKAQDLQQVNARLKDVKNQVNGVNEAGKLMNNAFGQFVPFSGQIKSFGEGFNQLKGGVGGVTKGFGMLKGAIIATGIGALVVLITALYQWLMKSQKGIELMSKVMAAFGGVMNVIIERVGLLIEAFKLIITGNFKEGFKTLGQSVDGIGKALYDGATNAWKLQEALIALEKKETDLSLMQARRKRETEQLLAVYEDETKSYDERRKALENAMLIEQAGLRDSIALAEERLRISTEEFKASDGNEEKRKKMIEDQIKLEELMAESVKKYAELTKKRNELDKKEYAEAQKAWENRIILEQISYDKIGLITDDELKKDLARKQKAINDEKASRDKDTADKLASAEREALALEVIRQTSIDTMHEGLETTIMLLSMDAQARKKHARAIKALTIGNMMVNFYDEVSSIWKFAEANPGNIIFPGFGKIIATLKTAFAFARLTAGVSKVQSQKFHSGGILRGPSHAEGGIPGVAGGYPIEMEGDEIILTGAVSRDPMGRAAASALNYRYGGIQFQNGGPVNPLAQPLPAGAAGSGAVPGLGANTAELAEAITRSLARMLPIVLKVQNNVQDTRRGIQVINELEEASNF